MRTDVYDFIKHCTGMTIPDCGQDGCETCQIRSETLINLEHALKLADRGLLNFISETLHVFDDLISAVEDKREQDKLAYFFMLGIITGIATYRTEAKDLKEFLKFAKEQMEGVSLCSSKTLN